jgi:hypothetical protein
MGDMNPAHSALVLSLWRLCGMPACLEVGYRLGTRLPGKHPVTVRSLDGLQTCGGSAADGRIEFVRNGRTESIRAGYGQQTGMKWLLDKNQCLIIKTGEGFCRD